MKCKTRTMMTFLIVSTNIQQSLKKKKKKKNRGELSFTEHTKETLEKQDMYKFLVMECVSDMVSVKWLPLVVRLF